jgi:hypothetical protein
LYVTHTGEGLGRSDGIPPQSAPKTPQGGTEWIEVNAFISNILEEGAGNAVEKPAVAVLIRVVSANILCKALETMYLDYILRHNHCGTEVAKHALDVCFPSKRFLC